MNTETKEWFVVRETFDFDTAKHWQSIASKSFSSYKEAEAAMRTMLEAL